MTAKRLSPEAYQVVQTMRRLYVEAGPEGRYGAEHWPTGATSLSTKGTDGRGRHCVVSRYVYTTSDPLRGEWSEEIRRALDSIGLPGLVRLNDHLGYKATIEALDRLLLECKPARVQHEYGLQRLAHNMRKADA